jgi:hypothetical protein
MKTPTLLETYRREISGLLECFDRVLLTGTYQAIGWPQAMTGYLSARGIALRDIGSGVANGWRKEIGTQIRALARAEGVEVRQVQPSERKEEVVAQILARRGRRPGVVCVLGAMERCRCFALGHAAATGWAHLVWSPGKCQHFYIYFVDAEFGLCHLRVPTWAPFRLQFYCNGHDWLERQMKEAGLRFQKADNCFLHVSDLQAAQALVRGFDPRRLHRLLEETAARWVSVHRQFGPTLHWSIHEAEWSADLLFKRRRLLPELYRSLVRTAIIEVGCTDIYHFLGKKPQASRKPKATSRLQTFIQGTRIKHTLGATSLKMYDKAERVLRIECTTHDVSTFTHYRKVEPRRSGCPGSGQSAAGSSGVAEKKWAPMRKTLYSLGALGRAMSACTRRYLAYISQWRDQTRARHDLRVITLSCRDAKARSVRGVNFFREDDLLLLQALQRGEHQIQGVRNRQLQDHLPGWSPPKIGRNLRRLRVLKILKRVPGTRKYYPTPRGEKVIAAGLQLTERLILPILAAAA